MSLILAAPAVGQQAAIPSEVRVTDEYILRTWTAASGLPSNDVLSVGQGPDGYIFIKSRAGTGVRTTRFDGWRFSEPAFATPDTQADSDVVFDAEGGRWHRSGETVGRVVDGTWRPESVPPGLFPFVTSRDGAVWVSALGRLGRWFGGEVTVYEYEDPAFFADVVVDRNGDTWAAGNHGLLRLGANGLVAVPLPVRITSPSLGTTPVYDLLEDSRGRLWAATAAGLLYREQDSFQIYQPDGADLSGNLNGGIVEDEEGFLWVAAGRDLFRVPPPGEGTLEIEREALHLSFTAGVSQLFIDREGSLWVATYGGGLSQVRRPPVKRVRPDWGPPRTLASVIWSAVADGTGGLWVAEECQVKRLGAEGALETFGLHFAPTDPPIMGNDEGCVSAVTIDRHGDMWLARRDDVLTRISDGVATDVQTPAPDQEQPSLWKILAQDDDIWYGRFDRAIHRYSEKDGLATYAFETPRRGDFIRALKPGVDGSVWFVLERSFGRIDDDGMTTWTAGDVAVPGVFWDVHVDDRGIVWVATSAGLFRLDDDGVLLTVDDGLADSDIQAIFEDDRGRLWLVCRKGLMVLQRDRVQRYLEGAVDSVDAVLLTRDDGVPQPHAQSSVRGARDEMGRLWLFGIRQHAVVDVNAFRTDAAGVRVLIERVAVDGSPAERDVITEVPAGTREVTITYTAPSFLHPERTVFRYRLDGYDDGWLSAGGRRAINYTNLWPGDYTFRVVARSALGGWSDEAAVRIRVLPAWWQTTWFMMVAILGIMGSGVLLQSLRTRAVRRRNIGLQREIDARTSAEIELKDLSRRMITAQEDDRARIARELHDDVAQRLAAATIGLEMSTGTVDADPAAAKEQLRALQRELDQVSDDVRKVSHELHPDVLHNLGLETALEVLCEEFQSQSGVTVKPSFAGPTSAVPNDVALCIYRVSQEALHNVAKHARADVVDLDLSTTDEHVRLGIRDDGVGFDAGSSRRAGLGLASIRERARLLDGSVRLDTRPGAGTELVVEIPITEATR